MLQHFVLVPAIWIQHDNLLPWNTKSIVTQSFNTLQPHVPSTSATMFPPLTTCFPGTGSRTGAFGTVNCRTTSSRMTLRPKLRVSNPDPRPLTVPKAKMWRQLAPVLMSVAPVLGQCSLGNAWLPKWVPNTFLQKTMLGDRGNAQNDNLGPIGANVEEFGPRLGAQRPATWPSRGSHRPTRRSAHLSPFCDTPYLSVGTAHKSM